MIHFYKKIYDTGIISGKDTENSNLELQTGHRITYKQIDDLVH